MSTPASASTWSPCSARPTSLPHGKERSHFGCALFVCSMAGLDGVAGLVAFRTLLAPTRPETESATRPSALPGPHSVPWVPNAARQVDCSRQQRAAGPHSEPCWPQRGPNGTSYSAVRATRAALGTLGSQRGPAGGLLSAATRGWAAFRTLLTPTRPKRNQLLSRPRHPGCTRYLGVPTRPDRIRPRAKGSARAAFRA